MSYLTEMSFIPKLEHFLHKNGEIYTVRKYRMDKKCVVVGGVGECLRDPICEIVDKEELEPYVSKSGFDTLQQWWDKILHFIPNPNDPKYLYKVTKR